MIDSVGKRLEKYSAIAKQEVLIVTVEIDGVSDRIAIFKGFSSSLTSPTAFDPDVPVIPDTARIVAIDRVASPYNPQSPQYIQQGLTWKEFQPLLTALGI
ncbi:hypothetical protein H6G17_06085 [Chroococcidiopsis sp. FACHB-1243]|uniref:DUF7734 family protein n=1 Tax=Chroococcidiopsis sp. [FACHB-1243] TaxID=2692781 RepID=UPI001783A225|nr:hypothetical protein [Chroococcidiopsis sp. [FACHB-1243]]MBD2305078.1 hypothetical protein [Chroococcidiopsis sp. [FACHB-1243]]